MLQWGGYQMGGFCLVVKLHLGGCATNWANPSSYFLHTTISIVAQCVLLSLANWKGQGWCQRLFIPQFMYKGKARSIDCYSTTYIAKLSWSGQCKRPCLCYHKPSLCPPPPLHFHHFWTNHVSRTAPATLGLLKTLVMFVSVFLSPCCKRTFVKAAIEWPPNLVL